MSTRTPTAGRTHRMSPVAVLALSMATALFAGNAASQQAAWKPERNVEIVVGSGPGGGLDRVARTMQQIWQAKKTIPVAVNVANRPGGSGTIGYQYLNTRPGDGHYLAITSPTLVTNHILGTSKLSHTELTPVALLSSDYMIISVKAESPIRTGREFIERLRKDPGSLSIAIGSVVGGSSHIGLASVLKAGGVDVKKIKTVVFKSGAENVTALLGGHVDAVVGPTDQGLAQVQAGRMRVLGVTSPQRQTGPLAQVPTWKEQGVDALASNWRGLVGPTKLTGAQLAYWDGVMSGLVETDEWKAESEKNLWVNSYRNSADTRKFLDTEYAQLKAILVEIGLAQQ